MTTWRLLIDRAGQPGAVNMATDDSLLRAAREGVLTLRLYRWNPPCLSFGRNEPALVRYDQAAIERAGLNAVRRPTGGRAVWHDAEVTYAVAGSHTLFGSLRDTYVAIHELLRSALARLGAAASLAPPRRPPQQAGGACFAAPVGGEVLVQGRKVIGSAQVRRRSAFLQHGSILLRDDQGLLTRVTRTPEAAPKASSLAGALERPVSFDEVVGAIVEEAHQMWSARWHRPEWRVSEQAVARFSDPSWTWRR